MGGFSAQIQPSQSSAPAGKNAGLSSMQMGMNPIEQSPQDQLLKTQQLQAEQPSFPQGNQMQGNMGPPLGMMGGMQPQMQNLVSAFGQQAMGQMGMGSQSALPYSGNMPAQYMGTFNSTTTQDMMGRGGNGSSFAQNMGQLGMGGGMGGGMPQALPQSQSAIGGTENTVGKGGGQGKVTFPSQGRQPKMGMPNAYSNTMQPWDNQSNQQGLGQGLSGKGLGNAVGQMSKPTGKGA
jgi:hypothetical protein